MYQECCKKCGSMDLFKREKGTNTGLYCSDCGAWIKWMSKDEIRAFDYSIQKGVVEVNHLDSNELKRKELYEASLPLLEFMNKYYCPMDKAILTEGNVEIVCGDFSALLPIRD